jgi:hypothetical protein
MKRKVIPLVLTMAAVVILASLFWLSPLSRTSQAAPVPSGEAAFKGKVLLVHTSNMMAVFLLEKAQVQKVGDCSWLVGKGAIEDASYTGRTIWLRMEHIVAILEYDDLKQGRKALESSGVSIRIRGYSSEQPHGPPLSPPTKKQ